MANRFKKAAESRRESADPSPTLSDISVIREIERPVEEGHAGKPQEINVSQTKPVTRNKVVEDELTVAMSLRVPMEMRDALRLRYARTGEKMTAYIKRLIEEDMRKNPF